MLICVKIPHCRICTFKTFYHSKYSNICFASLRIWLLRAYKLRIFMFSNKLFLLLLYSNWLLIIVCFSLNLLSDISILSAFLGYHDISVALTKNVVLDSIFFYTTRNSIFQTKLNPFICYAYWCIFVFP